MPTIEALKKLARGAVAKFTAGEKACLDLPDAIALVVKCSGVPADAPLSTKLGDIFPSQTRRDAFCQCVANGVPTDSSEIPCAAGTTLQEVVDAIAC